MLKLPITFKKLSKRKYGCSTSFYQIGIKIFTSKEDCEYAYKYQDYAAKYKLGPKVGEKIMVGNRYGYITQIVNTEKGSTYGQRRKLRLDMKKINLDFIDNHHNNVGWIGKRLVCLDFDKYSIECSNHKKTKLPQPKFTEEW